MNAVTQTNQTRTSAETFREQWTKQESEVAVALPPHIPVERFMRVVMTAVGGNPDLMNADRRSLFESAMKAAQDGLLPDGRDGAFVIFNKTIKTKVKNDRGHEYEKKVSTPCVQWMPMVGGILKKIRNSGELLSLSAYVVYENDQFEYTLGDEETIVHRPCLDADRGQPKLVYAIAKTKDGGIYREIMTLKDVEKVRSVSRTGQYGPWADWWDEMAKKTVIRRLAKRLPMSSDLDDLIRRDDELYDFSGRRSDVDAHQNRLQQRGSLSQLLQRKPENAEITHQPQEGFQIDHSASETETLSSGPDTSNQDTSAALTSGSVEGGDPVDSSTLTNSAEDEKPVDETVRTESSPAAGELTEEETTWLKQAIKMLVAATYIDGDVQVLRDQYAGLLKSAPATVRDPAIKKALAASKFLAAVMQSEAEFDRQTVSDLTGLDIADIPELSRGE